MAIEPDPFPGGRCPSPVTMTQEPPVVIQSSHAGEFLQLPYLTPRQTKPFTAVLTLPCNQVGTMARFIPSQDGGLHIQPHHRPKTERACHLLLDTLGTDLHGTIHLVPIHHSVQMGAGYGTSTSDIFAAMRLILLVTGKQSTFTAEQLARIAFVAESAVDPIGFGEQVIWFSSRTGTIIEALRQKIPPMACLSFDLAAPVDTHTFNPWEEHTPTSRHLDAARSIWRSARSAIAKQNAAALAQAAMASADLNQSVLAFPNYRELQALHKRSGSIGYAISHSGSVATLLFDPSHLLQQPGLIEMARLLTQSTLGINTSIEHHISSAIHTVPHPPLRHSHLHFALYRHGTDGTQEAQTF